MSKSEAKLPLFLEAKTRIWYRMTNKKKNGFMTKADFEQLAECFIAEFTPDEKLASDIRSWLLDGWHILIKQSKMTAPGQTNSISEEKTPTVIAVANALVTGGKITEDQYVKAYAEILTADDKLFKDVFSRMVTSFFNLFDTDHDGYIDVDDMSVGLGCFGISHSDAVEKIFRELDTSGSGKVNRDTYVAAWVEYMMGQDRNAPFAKHLTPFSA